MGTTCILLAAGASSRFGSQKLLHTMPNGETLLRTCVKQYIDLADNIIVVTNTRHQLTETINDLPVDIYINNNTHLGMSESIKLGVNKSPDKQHFLFALADMPYIKASTINSLIDTLNDSNTATIVAPYYTDKHGKSERGNPVGLSHHFRKQLLHLSGDIGARILLQTYAQHVTAVNVNDSGILHDIDYPDDISDKLLN